MPLRGFALIDPGLRLGKVVLSMRMRRSYSLLEPACAAATVMRGIQIPRGPHASALGYKLNHAE
jgi:hypothetical protein